jgi:GntR family transcriptional regulator
LTENNTEGRPTVADKTDGRPLHQQIAAEIRAEVMAGDLKIGAKLPATRELEARFGVTNTTVQDALQLLKNEGILEGKRGQGVFVRERKPHVVDVAAYFPPSPDRYTYKILDVAEVRPPADVAEALGLTEDETALLRHRMTLHRGEPVELNWSYYPLDIARGTDLMLRKKIKGGAPRVSTDAGFPWRRFVDQVSTRPPTPAEATALGLPTTVSVICQTRVVYSDNDRPVEVTVMAKAGHLYELRYQQQIS